MQRLFRLATTGARAGQYAILFVSLYQSAITILGYRKYLQIKGQVPEPPEELPRFGLLVCARNEEAVIANVVNDLQRQDYPLDRRDLIVVAHNCTDNTASVAARAGARVLEHFTDGPGKAHAIEAGRMALGPDHDLIGVFDADTRIPPGLLTQIAMHSRGKECLQAETIPIADHEWLAEGYGFGRKARNLFWWRPREALGLSTTITGSGWFIRPEVLAKYATGSWTLTEDLELSARLVADGHSISYVSAAQIACGETRSLQASMNQRARWVRGHIHVVMGRWMPLVRAALLGDRRAFDLAMYLVVPTRLLTRMGVTGGALLGLIVPAFRLPGLLVWTALAGEWVAPAYIGWRERLVHLSSGSLRVAMSNSLLSLLWFPIGIWAMGTARLRAWHAMPRVLDRETHHVS
ncbi:MAG: glycosyltransferase [Dehalococcoidia bacterium]